MNGLKQEICDFLMLIIGLVGFVFFVNSKFISLFACLGLIGIIYIIKYQIIKKERQKNNLSLPFSSGLQHKYIQKNFMTDCEKDFYFKLKDLENDYIIIPQLNLATVVHKVGAKYCSELFRNIDFAIFDKDYHLLLLIELNDRTHTTLKRRDRDLKVKKILDDCHIPLITFYTYYPNENQYVINRVNKVLNEIRSKNN